MVIKLDRIGDSRDFLVFQYRHDQTVEIVDIAVNSERRKGIGRSLVRQLCHKLEPTLRVYAITRINNEVAHSFYESLGFCVAGVLRRFYSEDGADAVMYVRSAGGPI